MSEIGKIVDLKKLEEVNYWALDNGKIGCSYFVDLSDCEIDDIDQYHSLMEEFVKNLPLNVKFRVFLYSQYVPGKNLEHSRKEAVLEFGEIENILVFNFEMNTSPIKNLFRGLKSSFTKRSSFESAIYDLKAGINLRFLNNIGLEYRSLNEDEIFYLLPKSNTEEIVNLGYGVDLGHSIVGVVRLKLQGTLNLSMMSLNTFKDRLPLDFQYRIAIQKIASEKQSFFCEEIQKCSLKDQIISHKQNIWKHRKLWREQLCLVVRILIWRF